MIPVPPARSRPAGGDHHDDAMQDWYCMPLAGQCHGDSESDDLPGSDSESSDESIPVISDLTVTVGQPPETVTVTAGVAAGA